MRIISGSHKGRRINPPAKLPVRPTTDVAKEGLFNILTNRLDFEEIRVLDLFAGTGSISFEFASRGVPEILSVDQNAACIKFVSEFAKNMQFDAIQVLRADAMRFLKSNPAKYDLIFADPPYDFQHYELLIQHVFENNLLEEDGFFIIEHGKESDFSQHENFLEARRYGHVHFSFFTIH